MSEHSDPKVGMRMVEIDAETFREFARRNATSQEIGPIGTCLDRGAHPTPDAELHVIGLKGCDTVCAAATFQLFDSTRQPSAQVLKLDSIIVDSRLRRRGLGSVLVAKTFADLIGDASRRITRIYAHAVHPATVAMLRRLGFGDPPVVGAPISDRTLDGEARDAFIDACEEQVRGRLEQMRLQCEYCRTGDRRARPWCLPRR